MRYVILRHIPCANVKLRKRVSVIFKRRLWKCRRKNKVIEFLMGLNVKKYHGVIGNIIGMDPLPNLSREYHIVQQAEKQRMIQQGIEDFKENEMGAFNVAKVKKEVPQYRESRSEKMKLRCDHCGKRGHLIKGCYELNGYPDWWKNPKPKGSGRFAGNVIKEEMEDDPLADTYETGSSSSRPNQELINTVVQEVVKMMNVKQGGRGSSSQVGSFAGTLVVSNVSNILNYFDKNAWVIDSGASDRIAGNKNLFDYLMPFNKGVNVRLPNGTIKTINHVGTVTLSDEIKLRNILYMPEFKHNLLSMRPLY
ncbi:Retrovirus-related Pol polyprotein from transposon RE1 [Bienertia sinuspersici]